SFFIAFSFYCVIRALNTSGRQAAWYWYASYAGLALAVLTKGLLSLVVGGGTLFLFFLITGTWRRWREFRLGTGTLLFLLIAAPWHILAGIRNQHFFWFYFVNEHFLRFLGKRYPKDYNKLPALAYWLLHLVWLFPWSFFLPVAIKKLMVQWRERRQEDNSSPWSLADQTRLLCLLWSAVVLVFFAFSTNQEYYTFPAYFPMLMLVADALAGRERSRLRTVGYFALLIVGWLSAIALSIGLWSSRQLPFQPDVGSVLTERAVGNYTLSMSHFFDLTGASFAGLRLPAFLAALGFLLGPAIALWLYMRKRAGAAIWAVAFFAALFLFAAHLALVRFEPYLSSRSLARAAQKVATPESKFMIYGDQSYGSSWIFYLQKQVYLVNGRTTSMQFGSNYPDAPKIFLNDSELVSQWKGAARIFLFVPLDQEGKIQRLFPHRVFDVARTSANVVLSNQP
ncbi:MAG TPA: glycosyl transferase, partial [Terriglobales bacterium]